MLKKNIEPKGAFPYKPPSIEIKKKYSYIFKINHRLPERFFKKIFDKLVSFLFLLLSLPIFLFLKIAYIFEGLIIPENSGPMFFYYNAISEGKVFRKYKIRLIKTNYIIDDLAQKGDWRAYSAEWNKSSRTYIGIFVKKFYLDELPQFYNVLIGDMSLVGPRPLSVVHYKRDLAQGNVTRKLIKGGLLGMGHIMKGKPEFGDPTYEYEYIHQYILRSDFSLFCLDLKIIIKGILLIFKGGGY
jgi:lipopolysaccharide/colanic/teichoic acid biosynthesis glycosyltransferase